MIRSFFPFLCGLLLTAAHPANAHSIWIEPKGGALVVRFAEPGSDWEKSPGYLDHLTTPIVFIDKAGGPRPLEASKQSDGFLVTGASSADSACVETTFTVRGGRKPIFYARWQPSLSVKAQPSLTLDLVPTGQTGEVRVYFRGQPLAGAAATLRGPDEKEIELTSGAGGFLRFDCKQPGQYLLILPHYREPLAGFHLGAAYKETSHNAALTWRQP